MVPVTSVTSSQPDTWQVGTALYCSSTGCDTGHHPHNSGEPRNRLIRLGVKGQSAVTFHEGLSQTRSFVLQHLGYKPVSVTLSCEEGLLWMSRLSNGAAIVMTSASSILSREVLRRGFNIGSGPNSLAERRDHFDTFCNCNMAHWPMMG